MHPFLSKLLDGVQVAWVPLGEVAEIQRGTAITKKRVIRGSVPVIAGGRKPAYYHNESNRAGQSIVISASGAYAGFVSWWEEPIFVSDAFTVKPHQGLLPKYCFYFLQGLQQKLHDFKSGGGVPHVYPSNIAPLKIPLPCPNNPQKSLRIQAEIVRILDTFTALITELNTELKLRQKQYRYYRERLLTFKEGEVAWVPLGEVAEYSKTRIGHDQLDPMNYVGVDNLLQNCAGKTESNHVPTSGNFTKYRKEDTLIGNIRPYLKKIWYADRVGGASGDVLVVRLTDAYMNPRYLYQVLADDRFFNYNTKHARGAKMPRGNRPKIMTYSVPLPYPNDPQKSLAEQTRIVSILDKFDTLTHSIQEGLPYEIALRQKQYAYYRDLLLNFSKPQEVA